MISAWWLLPAFWLGACFGAALMALFAMSRRRDEAMARSERMTTSMFPAEGKQLG
jgi:hypothetical protein